MNAKELRQIISDCCNDVIFRYNKSSGITSEVKNSIPIFQSWHGDKIKMYNDIEEVMSDKFF